MKNAFGIVTVILLLSACASVTLTDIKPGQKLVIDQPLVIPAGSAQLDIQFGKIAGAASIDLYKPHCRFIAQKVLNNPQTISKDNFLIRRISHSTDYVSLPFMNFTAALLGPDEHLIAMEYTTNMDIFSQHQSDIIRLSCSHWEDPDDARHLTIEKINQTLSPLAHIE